MDQTLISLYHRHVAAAFDGQMRLDDLLEREGVAGAPFQYTTSKATLEFGTKVRLAALDLGSYAEPDGSWLWAWCNRSLKLTPTNRRLGASIRRHGRSIGINALAARQQLSCEELLGEELAPIAAHLFAVIVSGELEFDAYYTIPFENGRFAVLIDDKRLRIDVPNVPARILSLFPQLLQAFPVLDHRAAFMGYARSYFLDVKETAQTVRVLLDGKEVLKATFDRRNRMTRLTGTVGPVAD